MELRPLDLPEKGNLVLGIDEHFRTKNTLATTVALIKSERKLLGLIPKATSAELVNWVKKNLKKVEKN